MNEKSIIENVKEYLGITEIDDEFNLLPKLREARNNYHPDKFTGEESKKLAENKFTEASALLNELSEYLEKKKLLLPSTELAEKSLFFEKETAYNQLEEANSKIKDLEFHNRLLKDDNTNLKNQLKKLNSSTLSETKEKIIGNYKVGKKIYLKDSSLLILTAIPPLLSQIEVIKNFVEKYSPISTDNINIIMFILFIIIILSFVKKIIEFKLINNKIDEITSAPFIQKFMDTLSGKKFSELDVYTFLNGSKCLKIKNILKHIGFRLFKAKTLNHLSEIFIKNLLAKDLISYSGTEDLKEFFSVKSKNFHLYEPMID